MPQRPVASALAWLLAALAISLGAAGIVAAMDHSGTGTDGGSPPRGDAVVHASLDDIEVELRSLSGDVDALGVQARGALAALVANDTDSAATAIATGDALVVAIGSRTTSIAAALADVPLLDTPEGRYLVSDAARDRHARLELALDATGALDTAWASLTLGSVPATRLSTLLATHDEGVLAAAERGRAGDYAEALTARDDADAALADSRRLRDQLARTVDITTLDQWLDRSEAYDVALRGLYEALIDADGRITDTVRRAVQAEADAKADLPGDSRGLILIMNEIGRGGMNGAVIAIEETRGRLAEALAEPTPSPTR